MDCLQNWGCTIHDLDYIYKYEETCTTKHQEDWIDSLFADTPSPEPPALPDDLPTASTDDLPTVLPEDLPTLPTSLKDDLPTVLVDDLPTALSLMQERFQTDESPFPTACENANTGTGTTVSYNAGPATADAPESSHRPILPRPPGPPHSAPKPHALVHSIPQGTSPKPPLVLGEVEEVNGPLLVEIERETGNLKRSRDFEGTLQLTQPKRSPVIWKSNAQLLVPTFQASQQTSTTFALHSRISDERGQNVQINQGPPATFPVSSFLVVPPPRRI
eukprot:TRINITY_DN23199_c0_g1_i1.p1 TRINITY_DN23199_c0_g1~~TRINITY_DN23199_c0_g1_i1.p1  ORF type:complete len:275 (-),score=0.69 TRINITY_DN23199_c0_g1_i1:35-859(-)